MDIDNVIAEQNTERLLQSAYKPDPVPPEFAASLQQKLLDAAKPMATVPPVQMPLRARLGLAAIVGGGLAACLLVGLYAAGVWEGVKSDPVKSTNDAILDTHRVHDVVAGMVPRKRPAEPKLDALREGESLITKAAQRKLVQLADGTRLYVNEKSHVEATGARQLTLHKGQIYLEVAPLGNGPRFSVKSGGRAISATGTHFAVEAHEGAAGVVVTQGKVAVTGIANEITAGQRIEPGTSNVSVAPRASHTLAWTRDLMAAAETPMVPGAEHAGGALLALDPNGQEIKLSLRKYHIDVHIEDGFARTTIDQTYFNTTWERLEGTFYFPLPPDASLSRLAMYVADANNQCKLMEGGMAERKHAADVYETIRFQRRDPALLEWLDGSTFKMRVFPLEAKQEKRIILSYTQKLPSLYGVARYRFAGGHNMPVVRDWSFSARVKNGATMGLWSPSHAEMNWLPDLGDLGDMVGTLHADNIKPSEDVLLEVQDRSVPVDQDLPRFATFQHENQTYLMLRYRPALPSLPQRQRRDWIVLFEASAQRDPLVAGTQADILRQVLRNAEYDDTFTLVTANSKTLVYNDTPLPARPKQVENALKFLYQSTHLVGALDLEQGLRTAVKIASDLKNPHLLHIGAGIPAMGERDAGKLVDLLPSSVRYVGVGVAKRWNRALMKTAAERTGGLFTQINPDEVIGWRAFDVLATLNTPRLLNVQVLDGNQNLRFLAETTMIAQGEELCAITRVDGTKQAIPGRVVVKGTLDGKEVVRELQVINVAPGAGYLPRTWAKLEIDRLLADGAEKNKSEITTISKAMYVMSPFTSLLVLETDADYETYKVDRGRKDHWAMYVCPAKIPLVYEPDGPVPAKPEAKKAGQKPSCEVVLDTIVAARDRNWNSEHADILERLEDTRTGSLMLGRGVNPDDRFVGSIVLGERELLRKKKKIAGGRVYSLGQFGMTNTWALNSTAMQQALDGEKSFDVTLRWQAKERAGLPTAPNAFRMIANGTKKEKFERNEWETGDLLSLPIGYRIEHRPEEIDAKNRKEMAGTWRRFWKVGEVIILGNTVTQDRVIERMLSVQPQKGFRDKMSIAPVAAASRIQFAPVFVRPNMRWEVPNTMVSGAPGFTPPQMFPQFGHGEGTDPGKNIGTAKSDNLQYERPEAIYDRKMFPQFGYGEGTDPGKNIGTAKSDNLQYERPEAIYDRKMFTDLVQYAPGLHANDADIRATLEQEADIAQPTLGKIAPNARKLIDRGRSADWFVLTVPAEGPLPSYKVFFNGLGQFAYERILVSGLREQVMCDGKTLWHLYPEIGLASKRRFSRHHQSMISAIAPGFVPSAEELAPGHDVKTIDANTVALIPLGSEQTKDGNRQRLHLIFGADGRLSERRIVEGTPPHPRPLSPWGERGENPRVAPAQAPNLQPNVDGLVVIELPLRTREHIVAEAKKRGMDPDSDPETVTKAFILDCMTGSVSDKFSMRAFGKVLRAKGERRIGFYTLLNAANFAIRNEILHVNGKSLESDIEKEHPRSALAMFLAQGQREIRGVVLAFPHGYTDDDPSLLKNLPGPKDGFIQKLARFRAKWVIWNHQMPSQDKTKLPLAKAEVLAFLQETTSPVFAYAVLDTMQRRCEIAPTDHMMDVVVKRLAPISDPLGLGFIFRYENARSLWQAGNGLEAAKQFKLLHADTLRLGMLPPIDAAFREVLQMPVGDGPRFIPFVRQTLDELMTQKRYGLAFQLAKQIEKLDDEALSDEILTTILAKAPAEERNLLTVVSVHFQIGRNNFMQADRLVQKLLEDKKLAGRPELWYWRSQLAQKISRAGTAVTCMEKALDLEYADLPELVDLEQVRTDYRWLLNQYQTMAGTLAAVEKEVPTAFLAKVIRTADRWRLLDGESAEPCLLAGKIFHTLGKDDLAWAYWTTPVDLHPAESKPWLDLADAMTAEGDLDRADRAFTRAFETEPTNPVILWKRAHNLVRMGNGDGARTLYRQIADGKWQERFNGTVEQARGLGGR